MSTYDEIKIKFPKNPQRLKTAYNNCKKRNKYVELDKKAYKDHLEMAKDDLMSIQTDFNEQNWRWAITKSYYSVFHAMNALLINNKSFFSKDHSCAIIAMKQEQLINQQLFDELGQIYEKFSDISGFAILFEARKISQYDVLKWKELTKNDAEIAANFAKKFVAFVEEACE